MPRTVKAIKNDISFEDITIGSFKKNDDANDDEKDSNYDAKKKPNVKIVKKVKIEVKDEDTLYKFFVEDNDISKENYDGKKWFNYNDVTRALEYKSFSSLMHKIGKEYSRKLSCIIECDDKYAMSKDERNSVYVSEDGIKKILSTLTLKKRERILCKFEDKQKSSDTLTVAKGNILQLAYEGSAVNVMKDHDGTIYFRAKDISHILEYKNTKKAIIERVEKCDKKTMEELTRGNVSLPLTHNQKNTIFINQSGVFSLMLSSKMKKAKEFKHWVTSDVLSSINESGSYSVSDDTEPESFYKKGMVTSFDGKRVLYVGCAGVVDGEKIYKVGISADVYGRDWEQIHVSIPNFDIKKIVQCDMNHILERKILRELKLRGLKRRIVFSGRPFTEMFVFSDSFTYDDLSKYIDEQVKELDIIYASSDKCAYMRERERTLQLQTEKEIAMIELEKIKENVRLEEIKLRQMEIGKI